MGGNCFALISLRKMLTESHIVMLTAHFMFGTNQTIKTNVLEAFKWMSALYNFKVIILSNDHKH